MIGKRFGKLLVLEFAGKRDQHRHHWWKTKCDCGNIHYVRGTSLTTGGTKSCGCAFDKHIQLSNKLLERLDGLLLGDGSYNKRRNSRLQVASSKNSFIDGLSAELNILGLPNSTYKSKLAKHLRSLSYLELTNQRKRWYPNGIKAVPNNLILTPIICLFWYLGDGSLTKKDGTIKLHTNCFSRAEVSNLISQLKSRFGIVSHIQNNGEYPIIYIESKSRNDWFTMIGKCPEWANDYLYRFPK